MCIDLALLRDKFQAGLAREVDHDFIFGQAMHEQRGVAARHCAQLATIEQEKPIPVAAMRWHYAETKLSVVMIEIEREMSHSEERLVVAKDAEHLIVREIDLAHIFFE